MHFYEITKINEKPNLLERQSGKIRKNVTFCFLSIIIVKENPRIQVIVMALIGQLKLQHMMEVGPRYLINGADKVNKFEWHQLVNKTERKRNHVWFHENNMIS